MSTVLQSLAAVLVVGILLGSFIALFALRHVSSGNRGTPEDTPVITAARNYGTDGTVYGLKAQSGIVAWQYTIHQGVDEVVQYKGAVYISSILDKKSQSYLYKLNLQNGDLLWQKLLTYHDTGQMLLGDHEANHNADIVVNDEAVVAASPIDLIALNPIDGSPLWRQYYPVRTNVSFRQPMIHDDVLYLQFNTQQGGGIKAFQIKDGKLLWTSTAIGYVYTATFLNNAMYIIGESMMMGPYDEIVTLDTRDGRLIKSVRLSSYGSVLSDTLTSQGIFIANTWDVKKKEQACAYGVKNLVRLWCLPQNTDLQSLLRQAMWGANQYLVVNDTLYDFQITVGATPSAPRSLTVKALDIHTGIQRWVRIIPAWHTVNLLGLVGTNDIIYQMASQGIYAFSAIDGRLLWHSMTDKSFTSVMFPLVEGQQAYHPIYDVQLTPITLGPTRKTTFVDASLMPQKDK